MEGGHQSVAYRRMGAGSHQGGGLATGHFQRKTGAAEGAGHQARSHFGADFMAEQAGRCGGLGRLEAFAQPGHGHTAAHQGVELLQHAAQPRHGGGDDEEVGIRRQAVESPAVHAECRRKSRARQVAGVGTLLLHGRRLRRIARPQVYGMARR